MTILPVSPTARELAADAIARAARDPIAAHRRAQRDPQVRLLDLQDREPLSDGTHAMVIGAHVGAITLTKPPGLFKRLIRALRDAA